MTTTSDTDLVATKKEMCSNLSDLADLVAPVNDEEQRARKGKAKIVYEEEDYEDSNKKILFRKAPKKYTTRRYPQHQHYENLNGASSSSSRLRLRWPDHLMEYAEAQRGNKQYDDEPSKKKRIFDRVPTKKRSFPQQRNQLNLQTKKRSPNPNSQSSPSSCLTESTSPKSHDVSQSKSSGHQTAKIAPFSRTAERAMPWWLVSVMRDMKGEHPMLILEKTLFESDVNPTLNRFSMPLKRLIRKDLLTEVELGIFKEEINNGVGAILVDPRSVKWGVVLKRLVFKDYSGIESWTFSLTCGWNDVVEANKLEDGDNIALWSFRCRGILCFALVPDLPPPHGTE